MIDFNQVLPLESSAPIDYEAINVAALANAEGFLSRWQPGGKRVGHEYVCGSINGGAGTSCSTNLNTGRGSDFATGDSWGDPIGLVATIRDVRNSEAAKILAGELGLAAGGDRPHKPLPQQAPKIDVDRYERGRATSARLLGNGVTPPPEHPYLKAKDVPAGEGVRMDPDTGALLVPLKDRHGTFWSVQRIFPNGEKKIVQDGRLTGNSYTFDGLRETIYVAEGYATAATVAEATGCMTIMAVSAGNLATVAAAVAEDNPRSTIVIAADWDPKEDGRNPGLEAAQKAAAAIPRGAKVLPPPHGANPILQLDWNDYAGMHGIEVAGKELAIAHQVRRTSLAGCGLHTFRGEPPAMEWIVENVLPRGSAAVFAAPGGSGKGMMTLDLALQISAGLDNLIDLNDCAGWMGNKVKARGSVVIISAEDNRNEIHRRLQNLDPTGELRERGGDRCRILTLPNRGGAFSLIRQNGAGGEYTTTDDYNELLAQLLDVPDLCMVNFDPLASFVHADINADPAVGSYVMSLFANLAERLHASVLIAHHMNKTKEPIRTLEGARLAIRGTSALVDGVRSALAMWPMAEDQAKEIARGLKIPYKSNLVFGAGVAKSNGEADNTTHALVRDEISGLLRVRDKDLLPSAFTQADLLEQLRVHVGDMAAIGAPYAASGASSIDARLDSLTPTLRGVGKGRIGGMLRELLEKGDVVRCNRKGTVGKWLDIPTGKFAEGAGEMKEGAITVPKKD